LLTTDTALANYTYATHYSYDIDGNVNTLVQDFPALAGLQQRYKRVDYDYDLISGKVNMLSYDRGKPDQYYQQYSYDADNRITRVQTSSDGYIWKRDAGYTYFQHGPVGRIDLGDLNVQGIDYAYTLQGWLKLVNGGVIEGDTAMVQEGITNVTGRDLNAFENVYFKDDYQPITRWRRMKKLTDSLSLYNGNIARQDGTGNISKWYTYDQMNRLKRDDRFSYNPQTDQWHVLLSTTSNYSYDLDGNIKTLVRHGIDPSLLPMDSLRYWYPPSTLYTDKLSTLTDYSPNNYSSDIRNYPSDSLTPRYAYDQTGNTTMDLVSGQDTIQWNLYNKVKRTVNNTDTSSDRFIYDGAGNRVAKIFTKITPTGRKEKADYYMRDAQGNILATYCSKKTFNLANHILHTDYSLSEHDIYGSSRLGVKDYLSHQIGLSLDSTDVVSPYTPFNGNIAWYSNEYQDVIKDSCTDPYGNTLSEEYGAKHIIGQKQYEITDHLGNVLSLVSDKRILGQNYLLGGFNYFPFGQLISSEFLPDPLCLKTSSVEEIYVSVPTWQRVDTACKPCNVIAGVPLYSSTGLKLLDSSLDSLGEYRDSFSYQLPCHVPPGFSYTIVVNVPSFFRINPATAFTPCLSSGGTTTCFTAIAAAGRYYYTFTPADSIIVLKIAQNNNDVSGASITIDSIEVPCMGTRPMPIYSIVCENDRYQYGYNGQMKTNEWAGVGNHTTAQYWEYDTRIGRRGNIDPMFKKFPGLSPYATNKDNPIEYNDPKGDCPICALVGGIVGGVANYVGQVASNLSQGKSLSESFVKNVDFADVGISAGEGALAGLTLGASELLGKPAFAAARAAVDWKPGDQSDKGGLKVLFGSGKFHKEWSDVAQDALSEGIGLGVGKLVDIGGVAKNWSSLSKTASSKNIWKFGLQKATIDIPTAIFGGIGDVIIKTQTNLDFLNAPGAHIEIEPLQFDTWVK
jgi:hypothetical protein